MNRCTEWRGEHAAVSDNHVNYIDRLAKYEDSGLEPEEIQILIQSNAELIAKLAVLEDREKHSLCVHRELDTCSEYCDGWDFTKECYSEKRNGA